MQRLLALIPPGTSRIDLLAPPFAGHLNPVLAMGRALAELYQVRILSTQKALPRIHAAGLTGVAIEGEYDDVLCAVANPQYAVKTHPVRLYRQFREVVGLLVNFSHALAQYWRDEGTPDLVISDFTLPVVGEVCRQFSVPWWTSLPSPCALETADGVPGYCGGLLPPRNKFERVIQFLHRKKVRGFKRCIFWLFRKTIRPTGIHRLYREDGSESAYSAHCILALSEERFEFPRTWPAAVHFIGPALYTPPVIVPQPPFETGKRHVLVTLGTHLDWHKAEVTRAVAKLAQTLPDWVFHFTLGNPDTASVAHQSNLYCLPWVDYDRWVSEYDAVIHHGGAGIMWHCLKAERPALVYPVDYDQFDHAARLAWHGKGIWLKGGIHALEQARPLLLRLVQSTVKNEK